MATYQSDNNVFIIQRNFEGEVFYGVHNFSNKKKSIDTKATKVFDLLSETKYEVDKWNIDPFEFKWYIKL